MLTDPVPRRLSACFQGALPRGLGQDRFCSALAIRKIQMLFGQGSVLNNPHDRRAMRRFAMQIPASVRVSGIPFEFATQTENISAQGLFFYLDRWMSKGTRVEVTMAFPPQVTLEEPQYVRLQARVVRVEPLTFERVGVAAVIEGHEFLRPSSSTPSVLANNRCPPAP